MAYNTKLNTAVIALDSIVLPLSAEDLNAFYKKLHPLILFSDGLAVADSLDKFKVGLDYLISLHFSEKVKSFLHKSIQAYPNVFGYENGNQVYIYIYLFIYLKMLFVIILSNFYFICFCYGIVGLLLFSCCSSVNFQSHPSLYPLVKAIGHPIPHLLYPIHILCK